MMIRKCSKCDRYSFSLSRCLDGKVNPPTLKGSKEATDIFGLSYLCPYSKWWKKVAKARGAINEHANKAGMSLL
jgi:hypothetical protein